MNTREAFITMGLLLALVMMPPSARASERDQATEITFSQSVQIPGRVLPAGTYWFYPGHTPGHQFVYSNIEQQELAQAKHYTITAKVQNKRQTAVIGD